MRFLFCNIAWMNYYKGKPEIDRPVGGGSFVKETGYGHEMYNFKPETLSIGGSKERDAYCLGFFETKWHNGQSNQLHIEKIRGCELLKNDASADDVTVVYCAKHPAHNFTTTVGWYRHATVYRYYQEQEFSAINGGTYIQYYNAVTRAADCILLPTSQRSKKLEWEIPRRRPTGRNYGFGRANVWFAEDSDNEWLEKFLVNLEKRIEGYAGENWLDRYPEE